MELKFKNGLREYLRTLNGQLKKGARRAPAVGSDVLTANVLSNLISTQLYSEDGNRHRRANPCRRTRMEKARPTIVLLRGPEHGNLEKP